MDLAVFHNYAQPKSKSINAVSTTNYGTGNVLDKSSSINVLQLNNSSVFVKPTQFQPAAITNLVAPTPTTFSRNRIIQANTPKGTILLRVTVRKEVSKESDPLPLNESRFTPINQRKISTEDKPIMVEEPIANNRTFTQKTKSRSQSPILCQNRPLIKAEPCHLNLNLHSHHNQPNNHALYSIKSPDELEVRNRSNLLYDLSNDPTLSSTLSLSNETGGMYEQDYLFPQMDECKFEEGEHSNEAFHSDSGIRGWETNDPTSTFNLLAQIEDEPLSTAAPLIIENSPNTKQSMAARLSSQQQPNRRSRSRTAQNPTPRIELETLLASAAVDPSKPVGCVLLEAGVGAEFHQSGRIKSTVNQTAFNQSHHNLKSLIERTVPNTSQRNHQSTSSSTTRSVHIKDGINSLILQKPPAKAAKGSGKFTQIVPCAHKGCPRQFPSKSMMRKHLLIHGPRQHVCPICTRSFIERAKLKRHLVVHSGEKPFVCDYENCGKRFSLDFNLRTHIKTIHRGEREFACQNCGKRFAQMSNLNTHLRFHKKIAEAMDQRQVMNFHEQQLGTIPQQL